jgi:ribonucleoside-triphosphate reductase
MNVDRLVEPTTEAADYKDFKPNWGPIGEQVFQRTYARDIEILGRKESWAETVIRVVNGNLALVDPKFIEVGEREKLIDLLLNFAALPAGRHLNASGVKGRQFLFNCHAAGWDKKVPWSHFVFLFDELMKGGGVGSNYSNRYLSGLPAFVRNIDLQVTCDPSHPDYSSFEHLLAKRIGPNTLYVNLPDTREGWVESVEHPLKAAWGVTPYDSIVIDVSFLREKGQKLKTSGGIACGPMPLVEMLVELASMLKDMAGKKLTTFTAMRIDHIIAACVVAGGKRRSSRMSVKSWKDDDIFSFIHMKDIEGEHWTTNISVEIDDDFIAAFESGDNRAKRVLEHVVRGKRTHGEPGFWNRSLAAQGEREPEEMYSPNPCGEIGLHMWENCNLGHVNLQYFAQKPLRKTIEAFRLMSRWLVRATYGDISDSRQRAVVDKNRRIGVGFFGFHGWLALMGVKYSDCWKDEYVKGCLLKFRNAVDVEAATYAQQLGIPVPVKTTSVAPTGTVASLPGVSTGLQPVFAPWFKRRVRFADTDPALPGYITQGYPVYKDEDAKNTFIVEFWCEDPLVSLVRANGLDPAHLVEAQDEIKFSDYLEVQAMVQDIYANNAISFTVNLPEDRLPPEEDMMLALSKLLHRLKGTTVFPDKSRKNAPFERITFYDFMDYAGPKEVTMVEAECKGGCPVV